MQFPGYWVVPKDTGGLTLISATFDETELDPATNWKQAWQNQSAEAGRKGFVGLERALSYAAEALATQAGRPLSQSELERAVRFSPAWTNDRCEVPSLAHLTAASSASQP